MKIFLDKKYRRKARFVASRASSAQISNMKKKLEGKEVCFPLTKIGKNWVAEFVDSERNHIEVYTAL